MYEKLRGRCNWKLDFENLNAEKGGEGARKAAYAQAAVGQAMLSVELAERLTLQHRNVNAPRGI